MGDQLAVEKVTKQLPTVRSYQRGDVVVFNPTQVGMCACGRGHVVVGWSS